MQISKKGFPYPTLNNAKNYNCFKNSTYELCFEEEITETSCILKNVRISTNNELLIQLINKKKVQPMIMIECSSTIYKYSEAISLEEKNIEIPIGNLSGSVEISSIVYALERLEDFESEDFIDEYQGYKFSIEKYCPVAIDDGVTLTIEYDDLNDKKVSSIFSVVKSFDPDKKIMTVINDDKKIKIELPENEYNNFDKLNGQDIFQNVFFSIIIIPALTMCLGEIQEGVRYNGKTIEDIVEEHKWFLSVNNAYKKIYGVDITLDTLKNINILELSQNVMNDCIVNSINDFLEIITRTSGNEEEESYE